MNKQLQLSTSTSLRRCWLLGVILFHVKNLITKHSDNCLCLTPWYRENKCENKSGLEVVVVGSGSEQYNTQFCLHLVNNNKPNNIAFEWVLFVDSTSAFNTISLTKLVNQLVQTPIHNNLVNLVYSFMTKSSQRVITESGCSVTGISSIGSPQGYVWSPLLFSIYMQEMPIPKSGNYHLIKIYWWHYISEVVPPWQPINTWHYCQSTDGLVQL
mgnify:FL=1